MKEEIEKTEIRCKFCNKLLALDDHAALKLELKCLRCGNINSIFNKGDFLLFITDAMGRIVFINQNVKKFTGYTSKEVMGKTPAIWGKQMPEKFYKDLWNNILTHKKAVSVTLTNRKKNGELYKVHESISPILNKNGEVDFFLAIQNLI